MVYLSHLLDSHTPSYGNRNKFEIVKKSDINSGDVANDSSISTTVHIGTHIDMPYHFYENGQTIEDFDSNFWFFRKPLFVEIHQEELIIKDNLISQLENIDDIGYDILIVKTGIEEYRDNDRFWDKNYGFDPDLYDYMIKKFPTVRVLGFDSISVSSFSDRLIGREAHKRFLNPNKPILLLEDMRLVEYTNKSKFNKIIIAPLRISKCDGLPCTVIGFSDD
jgi:kynurenine formamidase